MLLSVHLHVIVKVHHASICSINRYCRGLLCFSVFKCTLLRRVIRFLCVQLRAVTRYCEVLLHFSVIICALLQRVFMLICVTLHVIEKGY